MARFIGKFLFMMVVLAVISFVSQPQVGLADLVMNLGLMLVFIGSVFAVAIIWFVATSVGIGLFLWAFAPEVSIVDAINDRRES
jgi:hypothetical protein